MLGIVVSISGCVPAEREAAIKATEPDLVQPSELDLQQPTSAPASLDLISSRVAPSLTPIPARDTVITTTPAATGDLPALFQRIKTKPTFHALRSAGDRSLAHWVFGESGPVTLILGGMHGNEYTPTVLSVEFIEWLESTPGAISSGRIVIAPLVDPDGFQSRRRGNDNGVDLNRNYPAKNWRQRAGRHGSRPQSEPETRFVMELLEKYEPRCIVSIHGPLACVNYDGPAEELARRMSHACGLPVRASVGYATPGSFGSYAGVDLQIPTITLELRPGRTLDPDFDACRKSLMAAHEFALQQAAGATTD